jgi:hypothetical protein
LKDSCILWRSQTHGPPWTENPLFYEYFNGDTGEGLGASHQTGWTALVASLIAAGAMELMPPTSWAGSGRIGRSDSRNRPVADVADLPLRTDTSRKLPRGEGDRGDRTDRSGSKLRTLPFGPMSRAIESGEAP